MSDEEPQAQRTEAEVPPPTPVIYEAVRHLGEQEMARPATSLWWSGVAAGLSISFSLLAQAVLREHLPDAPWRELLTALGYPVGFLIVVLSGQQLFTETTITVVLPVMARPGWRRLGCAARMWGIVLGANLVGTLFAALFCMLTPVIPDALRAQMLEISRDAMNHPPLEMGLRAVTAGYLMAAMVWLLPAAGAAKFHVVAFMTYLIGVGGFAHVVAGGMEAFLLVVDGQMRAGPLLGGFLLPALAGNIVGGTALFALISHAQVMKEIDTDAGP